MDSIYKWRGMEVKEAIIWAHLRFDRIERALNLSYLEPDLKDIANKLQEEATDKKEYAPQGSFSFRSSLRNGVLKPQYVLLISSIVSFVLNTVKAKIRLPIKAIIRPMIANISEKSTDIVRELYV